MEIFDADRSKAPLALGSARQGGSQVSVPYIHTAEFIKLLT